MKIRILLPLLVIAVMLAVMFVPQFNMPSLAGAFREREQLEIRKATYERNIGTVETVLAENIQKFEESRTAEVDYKDLNALKNTIGAIPGITITEMFAVDFSDGFENYRTYVEGERVQGVHFELTAPSYEDVASVLSRIQVPVYSFAMRGGNAYGVTLLTGGES